MKNALLVAVLIVITCCVWGIAAPHTLADFTAGMDEPSPTPALAPSGTFVPLAPIPGLNGPSDNVSATNGGIAIFLNNIYTFAIGIAVILAVAMIIWGGFEYALSEAITSKSAGKQRIQQALFGLVLVLSPALVFTIINPAILNLNVNIPPLKTTWGTASNPSSSTCTGTSCVTTTSDGYVFSGGIAPCTDNASCDAAYNACKATGSGAKTPLASVRCRKTDGTLTTRQDYKINFFSSYSCASGESVVVTCQQVN